MWTQIFRKCLVAATYQSIFYNSFSKSIPSIIDWQVIISEYGKDGEYPEKILLENIYNQILENQDIYNVKIKKFLKDSNKTSAVVKSILMVFLAELNSSNIDEESKGKLVSKYIKITRYFSGPEGSAVAHAVLNKLLQEE